MSAYVCVCGRPCMGETEKVKGGERRRGGRKEGEERRLKTEGADARNE